VSKLLVLFAVLGVGALLAAQPPINRQLSRHVGTLGAGGVVAVTVSTQLVASALLDRWGLLGLDEVALTPTRLAGFALLLTGTVLVTLR
jgi:uncharacterized membrane protein YdcZ (DUF606 family)